MLVACQEEVYRKHFRAKVNLIKSYISVYIGDICIHGNDNIFCPDGDIILFSSHNNSVDSPLHDTYAFFLLTQILLVVQKSN